MTSRMSNHVRPHTLNQIAELLLASCERVREPDRRAVLEIWRGWNEAFVLQSKPHRAILQGTVLDRLGRVPTSFFGRRAIQAYESQSGFGVNVLCEGALVGWSCTGKRVPSLDDVDADLVVTNLTFDWTFGLHAKSSRKSPLFLDREMLERAGLGDADS